ncbi:MAG: SurA N-terminal domain-containing protein [Spirochaetales bacterium]|nr:SurA N-terminal domain-containing protein [Spirochaetales bacterium]
MRRNKEKQTSVEVNRAKHPVVYVISVVILVIVVIAFIFMGSNMGEGRNRIVFGNYAGTDIEWIDNNYLDERRQFWADQYSQNSQSENSSSDLYQIFRRAFDETVNFYAVLTEAKKDGYLVHRSEIVDQIQNFPLYLDRSGNFDLELFDETTTITRNIIEKTIEQKILVSQYLNDQLFSSKISSDEVETYKNLMLHERSFNYVSFKFDDFPAEEIVKYGKENSDKFRKIRLGRIIFSKMSESDVQSLRSDIVSSAKSFEDMAREYSSDVYREQGGDMGFQYFYQLQSLVANDDAKANSIFNLPLNTVSEIIPNGDNYELYTALSEPSDADFEDQATRDDIFDYMNRYQRDVIENSAQERALAFQKKAAELGLKQACAALGIEGPFQTNSFPINYRSLFAQISISGEGDQAPSIASAGDSDEFFEKAFALAKDTVSEPILLSDQLLVMTLNAETTKTEEDWEAYNDNFLQSLIYGQSTDFSLYAIQQRLYQVSLNYGLSYQYVISKLLTRSENENIPLTYMIYAFLAEFTDFDKYIQTVKDGKLDDKFNENFTKTFGSSAG